MEWISISDQTPAYGEPVLFYDALNDWVEVGDWRADGRFWVAQIPSVSVAPSRTIPSEYVTHWCPLVRPVISDDLRLKLQQLAARADEEQGGDA